MQGNARRLLDKRCDGNSRLGKISKLGLAPVLWCIIFVLLVTYIHSVILGIYLGFHILNQLCWCGHLHAYLCLFYACLTIISIISVTFIFSNKYAEVDSCIQPSCMVWSVTCNCWIGDVLSVQQVNAMNFKTLQFFMNN